MMLRYGLFGPSEPMATGMPAFSKERKMNTQSGRAVSDGPSGFLLEGGYSCKFCLADAG
jgi:hypothetical protein